MNKFIQEYLLPPQYLQLGCPAELRETELPPGIPSQFVAEFRVTELYFDVTPEFRKNSVEFSEFFQRNNIPFPRYSVTRNSVSQNKEFCSTNFCGILFRRKNSADLHGISYEEFRQNKNIIPPEYFFTE